MHLSIGRNQIGRDVYNKIWKFIPKSIAGEFAPASPSIRVGWHDIFETAESEMGSFFGRAFFSFGLFGSGTPIDWEEYRRAVIDVPAVQTLRADLEQIVGPVKHCVYWDI